MFSLNYVDLNKLHPAESFVRSCWPLAYQTIVRLLRDHKIYRYVHEIPALVRIERRGQVVNIPDSYFGSPGLKSRTTD
jgi:hypothetical protein